MSVVAILVCDVCHRPTRKVKPGDHYDANANACHRLADGRYPGPCDIALCARNGHERLVSGIKAHRELTRGHGSGWENDLDLWRLVEPDATYPDDLPPREEFLRRCAAYWEGRCVGRKETAT